jgi:predicted TIM-barrel fold metal-dependent hydrolase
MSLPRLISVDDHVIDPPSLWTDRLSSKYLDRAPRIERRRVERVENPTKHTKLIESEDAKWADVWMYDDLAKPLSAGNVAIGPVRQWGNWVNVTYEEIEPGCWQQGARLADMDRNGTEAQLCFPQFPRFCGQTFFERDDKEFALLCLQAYNDFIIDEWCSGDGYGRLIPLTIVPLWSAELAAAEVRRCAAKGSSAITFSECPPFLGLPSLYTDYWEPMLAACDETETVINMHVGSSSKMLTTSDDASPSTLAALNFAYGCASLVDWLFSGYLERFPRLKIAFSESQVGWMPYVLNRVDSLWRRSALYEPAMAERVPNPPSSYVADRVFGCIYDDLPGLLVRDQIGMGQIMFETDYPHADTTFPHTTGVIEKLATSAGLSDHETWQMVRGNAIKCYGLKRFGIED